VVGVLVLVDQHVREAALVVGADAGVALQQLHRQHQEVVEVHPAGGQQPVLVAAVQLDQVRVAEGGGLVLQRVRPEQAVLRVGDPTEHRLLGEPLRVELEVVVAGAQHPQLVGLVEDREVAPVAEGVRVAAQDPHARGVEGAGPEPAGGRPDEGDQPVAHLPRGLVRERDRDDPLGPHAPHLHEVRDAVGEHPGLAAARAGEHEERTALVQHRLALGRVEGRDRLLHAPMVVEGLGRQPPPRRPAPSTRD
jgi:hypothetical protein